MSSSQPTTTETTTTTHPQHHNVSSLIITGITMGIFHVLTGPDHLSAIATLSANVGHYSAFWLGVRWGMGHSTGLCIVAGILIAMSSSSNSSSGGKRNDGDDDDADETTTTTTTIDMSSTLSSLFESIVGICMILLGFYGFYKAIDERRRRMLTSRLSFSGGSSDKVNRRLRTRRPRRFGEGRRATAYTTVTVDVVDTDDEEEEEGTTKESDGNGGRGYGHAAADDDMMTIEMTIIPSDRKTDDSSSSSSSLDDRKKETNGSTTKTTPPPKNDDSSDDGRDSSHSSSSSSSCPPTTPSSPHHHSKILACLVGIVHGIAGPGGVLGVIPAVQLRNAASAALYLGVFCVTSMIVMGLFAGCYGVVSRRVVSFCSGGGGGDLSSFVVKMMSSSLSVVVGVVWLVLIGLGVLDDVFP